MAVQHGSSCTLLPALHLMEKRKAEDMENHPFIHWTRRDGMSARDKAIAWLPSISVFAMEFKDYNNIILRYPASEAKDDVLKAAINEHAADDGTHWKWLMADIKTLDANISLDAVSFFEYFWGKDVQIQRRVFYDLVALAHDAKDPVLRYCLLTAFENVGNVVISAMSEVGNQFAVETGKKLLFIGQMHLDHENGHLQHSPYKVNEEEFWNQEVKEETLQQALRIVDRVFDINVERLSGYLTFMGENAKPNIFKNKS